MAANGAADALTCSICYDFFRAPVSWPCGHNFCRACSEGVIAASAQQGRDMVSCPPCRRRHPPEALRALHVNYALAELAEAETKAQETARERRYALDNALSVPERDLQFDQPPEGLGLGSFGEVVAAELRGTPVAVKTMRGHLSEDMKTIFKREALILAKASHPCVLPLMGFSNRRDGGLSIITPRATCSLAALLEGGVDPGMLPCVCGVPFEVAVIPCAGGRQRLLPAVAFRAALAVAQGLAYFHGGSANRPTIIHRDLKPSNILLMGHAGEPKIADLGFAKVTQDIAGGATMGFGGATSLAGTGNGGLVGTLRYMPPEALSAAVPQSPPTGRDIFSLGVVLCELLSGEAPLSDLRDQAHVIDAVVYRHQRPTIPDDIQRTLPNGAMQFIRSCLAADPKDRPTAVQAVAALHALAAPGGTVAAGVPVLIHAQPRFRWSFRCPACQPKEFLPQSFRFAALATTYATLLSVMLCLLWHGMRRMQSWGLLPLEAEFDVLQTAYVEPAVDHLLSSTAGRTGAVFAVTLAAANTYFRDRRPLIRCCLVALDVCMCLVGSLVVTALLGYLHQDLGILGPSSLARPSIAWSWIHRSQTGWVAIGFYGRIALSVVFLAAVGTGLPCRTLQSAKRAISQDENFKWALGVVRTQGPNASLSAVAFAYHFSLAWLITAVLLKWMQEHHMLPFKRTLDVAAMLPRLTIWKGVVWSSCGLLVAKIPEQSRWGKVIGSLLFRLYFGILLFLLSMCLLGLLSSADGVQTRVALGWALITKLGDIGSAFVAVAALLTPVALQLPSLEVAWRVLVPLASLLINDAESFGVALLMALPFWAANLVVWWPWSAARTAIIAYICITLSPIVGGLILEAYERSPPWAQTKRSIRKWGHWAARLVTNFSLQVFGAGCVWLVARLFQAIGLYPYRWLFALVETSVANALGTWMAPLFWAFFFLLVLSAAYLNFWGDRVFQEEGEWLVTAVVLVLALFSLFVVGLVSGCLMLDCGLLESRITGPFGTSPQPWGLSGLMYRAEVGLRPWLDPLGLQSA